MKVIQDRNAPELLPEDLARFAEYIRQRFTASSLVNILEKNFVIPSEYNYLEMERILPQSLYDHWVYALYDVKGRKRRYLGRYFAHPMMQNRRAKRDDYKPSAALVTGHYVP
ncbi:hypothetical protein [Piscirickettsia salmonis]|uniref:hypothetical protein n=1 Tax=Piscirickettsia salmonis TaxID=1238 RepID=UPI0007D82805|nr:hypothetical protein A0O36_02883 [Piscirickettsiaceae bacterium NZ-RLO1]